MRIRAQHPHLPLMHACIHYVPWRLSGQALTALIKQRMDGCENVCKFLTCSDWYMYHLACYFLLLSLSCKWQIECVLYTTSRPCAGACMYFLLGIEKCSAWFKCTHIGDSWGPGLLKDCSTFTFQTSVNVYCQNYYPILTILNSKAFKITFA